MSYEYPLSSAIDLHVKGRISAQDALRQKNSAAEILRRLKYQPGIILADEVGMGKTFVALAVAISIHLADPERRPAVVMLPSSLREKWPQDFATFCERCLPPETAAGLCCKSAARGVDFLKLLDDPGDRRSSVIFLTHGAMSRGLTDGWVKLALIQRALHGRHNTDKLYRMLCRSMADLLRMKWAEKRDPEIWDKLLSKAPQDWLRILKKSEIDPEGDNNTDTDDDPVPAAILTPLRELDTDELYDALYSIPFRETDNYQHNISNAKNQIDNAISQLWDKCIRSLPIKLPLLIMDEAHHLKNADTRLASLFHSSEAQEDADQLNTRGPLAGVFERMLFLTATPFQLGHHELCNVVHRFESIDWEGQNAPLRGQQSFYQDLELLRSKLDKAQESALGLEHSWGLLKKEDLRLHDQIFQDSAAWWQALRNSKSDAPILSAFLSTLSRIKEAESTLKPWIIRHLKARTLADSDVPRRTRLIGQAILTDTPATSGLPVSGQALLPFLLAARAVVYRPDERPLFAEGLASSYETFLHTRKSHSPLTDLDDDDTSPLLLNDKDKWYLDYLESLLSSESTPMESHPKVSATLKRVRELWLKGEKVLVFCHYIVTGRILRRAISAMLHNEITTRAAKSLQCPVEAAMEELNRLGDRFFDTDSPLQRACNAQVSKLLENYPSLSPWKKELLFLARRNVRTPSFLVRFFDLSTPLREESLLQAFQHKDSSGLSLRSLLDNFFRFLAERNSQKSRQAYIDAITSIQTGAIASRDIRSTFSEDERYEEQELLMPNVRLVNGASKQETRQRLMLTFNTPFFPEILIASSVMAEGVDLHCFCRHVIHHDLCWNPSTLEQRTGRIDRIGAKAEICEQSIRLYLPFISETQDEKMYRVVTDRERWFGVVMGEAFSVDVRTTDRISERVEFPAAAADELRFRLEVAGL